MTDIHVDDFYRDTAKTLVLLYNNFPRQQTLYVEDIAGPDTPDEFGLHSKRHEAGLNTLLWLANSDYLTYTSLIKREALEDVCLSHRTFILLNSAAQEQQLEHNHPHGSEQLLINRLRRELKSGSSASLALLVRELMVLSRGV